MAQHVTLSNGHQMNIPDGMTGAQIKQRVDQMEALINPKFVGWSDPIQSANSVLRSVTDPATRIAGSALDLHPAVGMADMGISGINALKAVASKYAPAVGRVPDIPTISGTATDATSMTPGPTGIGRYIEAGLTGIANPKNSAMTAIRMLGSTGGADLVGNIAQYYGGPAYEKLGRWLGSLVGGVPDKTIVDPTRAAVKFLTSGKQAQSVDQSGQNIDTEPTFGSLANTGGRMLEKILRAIPVVGMPAEQKAAAMDTGIENAKMRAAESVNQGPLPAHVEPATTGRHIIDLARQRSASIKAQAEQNFQDLYGQVGYDTMVDARPVLRQIQDQMNAPNVSADQRVMLQQRAEYLQSMMYGGPHYTGPQFGANIAPVGSMQLGQLGKFRSELGSDLQNMPALDTVVAGPVRDTVSNLMAGVFQRRNLGPQWAQANDFYKSNIGDGTPTAKLDYIGGTPVKGKPGIYEGGLDEGAAYNYLKGNTQSPSSIEPLVDPSNPNWLAAASQYLSQLGTTKEDTFRSDTYAQEANKISDDVLTQLTQGPNSGPGSAYGDIRDAQNMGKNSVVPIGRHGLTNSLGAFAGLEALSGAAGHWFADAGLPTSTVLPLMFLASKGLQSKAMTDAMAGKGSPTSLSDALYQGIPASAAALNLNDPTQIDPATQKPPPSPLDVFRQPQP